MVFLPHLTIVYETLFVSVSPFTLFSLKSRSPCDVVTSLCCSKFSISFINSISFELVLFFIKVENFILLPRILKRRTSKNKLLSIVKLTFL